VANISIYNRQLSWGDIVNASKKTLAIIIAGCFLANSAFGQELNDIREIALNCDSCHDGVSTDAPVLHGQKQKYLEIQLEKFRSKKRTHNLMSVIGKNISDDQLKELAKYYSQGAR